MKVAEGVHRLGSGLVNAYLVADGGGVTVIDAGLPGYWSDLKIELAAMGRGLEDLRAVVLTHGHSDHVGFAEKARTERGVPVSVHEARRPPRPRQGEEPGQGHAAPSVPCRSCGSSPSRSAKGGWHIDRLGEVATFGDGATLDVPGSPRVILVPGHTPGSAALHLADRGVLFVGDALATVAVTTGISGPQIAPFTADATEALASLDRLRALPDAGLVLPGHGEPWTDGIAAAVDRVRELAAAAPKGRR